MIDQRGEGRNHFGFAATVFIHEFNRASFSDKVGVHACFQEAMWDKVQLLVVMLDILN